MGDVRMENRKKQRRGLTRTGIIFVVMMVVIPVLMMVFMMPGGGGSGDYSHYIGPVLPMTSLSGSEQVEVTRNVNFDFLPYAEREEYDMDAGSAIITDNYQLTNTTNEAVTMELVYGFEGQFIDDLAEIPQITVNGEVLEAEIHPSVDIFGDIHYADNWKEYKNALTENDFLSTAMARAPQWDSPVTVYHFTNATYDEPEVDDTVHYGVQFSMPTDTTIWVQEYGMTRYNEETGHIQLMFREEWGDGWMFVAGEEPTEMTFVGNVGFNVTEDSALQGLSMQVETWESTFSECLWALAQEYDFWELNDSYPNPGLVTPEMLYEGAMKLIADPDYHNPSGEIQSMNAVFHDVVTDIRMLYWVFPVEIPAGAAVEVSARYTQEASEDYGGPLEPREGYDMATALGSNLNFISQSASVTNDHLIKILDQNFGFDLNMGITQVLLDLKVERYYMDIAPQ